ncbi:MAG: DUF2461 domain-containing protein [Clostridia bacterium]|nr:DUF2461 domain-containing protein [Clostridia bacterium]
MFNGFSPETSRFMLELALNNDRPWFEAHRDVYQKSLKEPMDELAHEVMAEMVHRHPDAPFELHISRIYRDARRLFGRGPYKEHLWFSLRPSRNMEGGSSLFFGLTGLNWSIGCDYWHTPTGMAGYRKAMDDDPAPMKKLARTFEKQDYFTLSGPEYSRKKGHEGDELCPWYNKKYLWIEHEEPFNEVLFGHDLVNTLCDGFDRLLPYYLYFLRVYGYGDR